MRTDGLPGIVIVYGWSFLVTLTDGPLCRSRRLKVKKEVTGAEKVVEALAAVPKQETERPEGLLNSTKT